MLGTPSRYRAGDRWVTGEGDAVLAVTVAGLQLVPAVGLLILMEAGVPIPIPDDLVMLAFGAQVASGHLSLWVAFVALEVVAIASTVLLFVAARGPGYGVVRRLGPRAGLTPERLDHAQSLIERRGRVALAVGRGTPGLRTVTGIAAGGSGLHARRALPPLIVGATVFVQLHLVLGLAVGPLALDLFHRAATVAVLLAIALVGGAAVFWIVRGGRRRGAFSWTEAACPVCLGLAATVDRLAVREADETPGQPATGTADGG
jgi:membrane protein DedA with SNARE-associated domain